MSNPKKIKVLFAPSNVASMPNITMQALNKLEEIDARGVSYGSHKYWTFGPGWKVNEIPNFKQNPIGRIWAYIKNKYEFMKGVFWADILMLHWDIDSFSALYIRLLRKKTYIEWIGSDIRVPEYVFAHNPYYKLTWESGEWDYMTESTLKSNTIQKRFHSINATPTVCPEISLFLNPIYFQNYVSFFQRIDLNNYKPNYSKNEIPILVHTPSATGAKGTKYVRIAIENLKKKNIIFEYIEIHNKTRQESLDAIASCDIFIDQFIVGSYGLATCEAMAMGKPVLCYLMPPVVERLPADCAIVNTNIDNLESTIEIYLLDESKRAAVGKLSRAFVEKYHDADKIAIDLLALYKKELNLL